MISRIHRQAPIMAKKLGLGTRDHMTWDLDKIDNEWIAMIRKQSQVGEIHQHCKH